MNRNLFYFAIKLGISVFLIGLIAFNFNLGESYSRIANLSVGYALLALVPLIILLFNNTLRWRTVNLAIGAKLGFWDTFRLLYIGMFFNQTLPSSVGGDAVRIYLGHKEGLTWSSAINGVMLERVATVSGLILLVVATQPILLARIGDHPAKFVFPILAVLAVIGIGVLIISDRFVERIQDVKFLRGVARLTSDTRKLFLSPISATQSIALGVTGNILIAFTAFFLGKALHVDLSLLDCLVLMPPVILITTIPISIAGWGVREGAMVTAFSFVGVSQGDAFVVSVMFGLMGLLYSLPGGIAWLLGGYSRGEVMDEVTKASDK